MIEKIPEVGGAISIADYIKLMNLAMFGGDPKAFKIPAIALFGPIHPDWSVEKNDDVIVKIYRKVACSPCNKKICNKKNYLARPFRRNQKTTMARNLANA